MRQPPSQPIRINSRKQPGPPDSPFRSPAGRTPARRASRHLPNYINRVQAMAEWSGGRTAASDAMVLWNRDGLARSPLTGGIADEPTGVEFQSTNGRLPSIIGPSGPVFCFTFSFSGCFRLIENSRFRNLETRKPHTAPNIGAGSAGRGPCKENDLIRPDYIC